MFSYDNKKGLQIDSSLVDTSRIGRKIFGVIAGIALLIGASKLMFSVNNHEVVALTYPNGQVEYFFAPGLYGQWLGHTESFEKRTKYDFEEHIQFSDGAHATIKGSVQYQVPGSRPQFSKMYSLYPSPSQIQAGLIETNLQKAVYLTGRTMSSKESYAERRGDLLSYMEDQLRHGPYQTHSYTREVPEDFDKTKMKIVNVVDIVPDQKAPGGMARQENGLWEQYQIETSNFNFRVTYDPEVEKQIQSMQQKAQQINDKAAEAKMAEQNAITFEQNGKAKAAEAKWAQETVNAKVISESQMQVEVARQQKLAAELNKQKLILEGEGEAEKKKLIMGADGALQQKLATLIEIARINGDAIKGYAGNWVPTVQLGQAGSSNGAMMLDALTVKALHDLSLDLTVPRGGKR